MFFESNWDTRGQTDACSLAERSPVSGNVGHDVDIVLSACQIHEAFAGIDITSRCSFFRRLIDFHLLSCGESCVGKVNDKFFSVNPSEHA
jgi:hypothetical protein